jgi:ribosomal protein L20
VKAGQHAYEDRKLKKRDQRRLWIERINAAVQAKVVNTQDSSRWLGIRISLSIERC